MAVTKISDVIVPEVFDDYVAEKSIYKNAFVQSGIVAADPKLKTNLLGGAKVFNTPFWKSNSVIGADPTPVDEDTTLTPGSIGSGTMIARRQFREKAFGQNDVAAVLAGEKPMDAIAKLLTDFWNRAYQTVLIQSTLGVLADNIANDGGDMVNDITAEADPTISSEAVIDTLQKFGDMTDGIVGIAMHSLPYATLQKDNMIDFIPDNVQDIGWGTYMGKTVIVDDALVSGGVYQTILFRAGAFGWAEDMTSGLYVPTEVDRKPEISGGQEIMYTRRVFAMHPAGFAYSDPGAPTADFPTNAELAAATQWDRVVSSVKNVGFVVLRTAG